MKKILKPEDIVKLMEDNDITLHEVARAMDCEPWIWCLDDFFEDMLQRNIDLGVEMSREKAFEIAKRAFAEFHISDCAGDFGHSMIRNIIQERLANAEEELEKELKEDQRVEKENRNE